MLTMLAYPVAINQFIVPMHEGAAVLSVALKDGKPMMWVLCDKTAPLVNHRFITLETGTDVPEEVGEFLFIGTFLSPTQKLAFHLFDAGDDQDEQEAENE